MIIWIIKTCSGATSPLSWIARNFSTKRSLPSFVSENKSILSLLPNTLETTNEMYFALLKNVHTKIHMLHLRHLAILSSHAIFPVEYFPNRDYWVRGVPSRLISRWKCLINFGPYGHLQITFSNPHQNIKSTCSAFIAPLFLKPCSLENIVPIFSSLD